MANGDGDIVFMIGSDVTALTRNGQAGEKSLAAMEKAAKDLERQIVKIGDAGATYQREMNKLTGVTKEFGKSARESAAAFEAFDRSKAQVDALRASIDPLFAASKRYEQALQRLDGALEQGVISGRQHEQMVEQVAAAYLRADGAAETMETGVGGLGSMSSATKGKIQQLGFQVQDVAVQLAAGTRATTVFAQQGSQILSIFGPVGAMLGVLAAVGLPLLGAAFASAGDDAEALNKTVQNFTDAADAYMQAASAAGISTDSLTEKYGRLSEEARAALEAMRQIALVEALDAVDVAIQSVLESLTEVREFAGSELFSATQSALTLKDAFGMGYAEAARLRQALEDLSKADGLEAQARAAAAVQRELLAAFGTIEKMPPPLRAAMKAMAEIVDSTAKVNTQTSAMEQLLRAVSGAANSAAASVASIGAAANQAYSGVSALVGEMWELAAAKAAAVAPGRLASQGDDGRGGQRSQRRSAGEYRSEEIMDRLNPGGGGGGGGGSDDFAADLERLRQELLTEEQIEMESYARRQEMLQQALEQKKLTQEEYAALMEKAQKEHSEKMVQLDVWRFGTALDKAGTFFGEMASAMQGGNERMLAISKKFAAAEALINAWQAFSQVLADKSLPFWAKIPSAMKVLAAGMGAVNAIKGGGGSGGSSRGSGSSATAAPQQATQTMNFHISNDPFGFGERFARQMADQINEASRNGMRVMATVTPV